MTINNRMLLIINEYDLNNNSFSVKIGVNPTVIHNIIKGRNAPGYDLINKILLAFDNIDANWLITGEGNMLKSKLKSEPKSYNTVEEPSANSSCKLCSEKDKRIDALERIIKTQSDFIDSLKDKKCSSPDEQKRKAG